MTRPVREVTGRMLYRIVGTDPPTLEDFTSLLIPEGAALPVERTLQSAGHHTLWGAPEELIRCVIAVAPV